MACIFELDLFISFEYSIDFMHYEHIYIYTHTIIVFHKYNYHDAMILRITI